MSSNNFLERMKEYKLNKIHKVNVKFFGQLPEEVEADECFTVLCYAKERIFLEPERGK